MRTVIDVPDDLIASLDRLSSGEKRSRASLIREAIGDFVARKAEPDAHAAFGLWKDRPRDGLDYQNRLRAEWDRE